MSQRLIIRFIVFCSLCSYIFIILACEPSKPQQITILHHNDFHAANRPYNIKKQSGESVTIQGIAGLKGLANAVRDTVDHSLWLFAGDEFTGTPISSMTKGASQIQICRRLGINVAVLGNHEFDYGIKRAEAFRDSLGIPVLGGANLRDDDDNPFAPEYYDTTIGTVKMRIIGLVPPNLHILTTSRATGGLNITDAANAVKKNLPNKSRLTVVLSHMGYSMDTLLARQVPEIDLIVGGHQHSVLEHPHLIGKDGLLLDSLAMGNGKDRIPGTLIVQAGAKGIYLGVLSLLVKDGDVVSASGQLLLNDGTLAPSDTLLSMYVDTLEEAFTKELDRPIATLTEPLTRKPWGVESNFGRWVTDAYRQVTDADVAFQNPGGIRKDLNAGPLMIRDIWESNPFGNTLFIFELSGSELKSAMEHSLFGASEPLLVSGITITLHRNSQSASDLTVAGKPMTLDKMYKAVTNSYIFGHFEKFFGFKQGERKFYDTGLIDRILLMDVAKEAGNITPPRDVRIMIVE